MNGPINIDPERIFLKNVELRFPFLDRPAIPNGIVGAKELRRYSALFFITPFTDVRELDRVLGSKTAPHDNLSCLRDGSIFEGDEGIKDAKFIRAASFDKPLIDCVEGSVLKSGDLVNVILEVYRVTNSCRIGNAAQMLFVQKIEEKKNDTN